MLDDDNDDDDGDNDDKENGDEGRLARRVSSLYALLCFLAHFPWHLTFSVAATVALSLPSYCSCTLFLVFHLKTQLLFSRVLVIVLLATTTTTHTVQLSSGSSAVASTSLLHFSS